MKFLFFVTILFLGLSIQAQSKNDMHLIYVNGVAERTVEPNMMLVRIESWAKASSAKSAQEQQAIQYEKIKTAVEKFKVKKTDLQTEGYYVNPEYFYDQKSQTNKVNGYRVSHSILIIYRNMDNAGSFLDSMVTSKNESSGINVNGVSWDYDNKAEIEASALADAIKQGRAKADQMAKAAGVSIKSVHKIQHTSYAPPVAQPMYERAMMKMSADSAAPATEVNSGQIKVRVDVQLEYEI